MGRTGGAAEMTQMEFKWTTDKPSKPGFYWYQPTGMRARGLLRYRVMLAITSLSFTPGCA